MRLIFGFLATFLTLALVDCGESDFLEKLVAKRKISEAQWSQWSVWGSCSKSCGGGIQLRTRKCGNVGAVRQTCPGSAKEEKPCNQQACAGQWTQWSQWTTCTKNEQSRTRTCTGGGPCSGLPKETKSCRSSSWSDWRPWSSCSVTCGNSGQQTRTRTCQGGTDCPNPNTNMEKRPCSPQPPPCAKWNNWSAWTTCSRTCGGGEQYRNRTCVSDDANATTLQTCKGQNRETQKCNTMACPKPKWSDWSAWTICTNGRQSRNRTCTGGTSCSGSATETRPCNVPAKWGDWSQWTACTKTCGGGEQSRQRTCINGKAGSAGCLGSATEKRTCNTQTCPSTPKPKRG